MYKDYQYSYDLNIKRFLTPAVTWIIIINIICFILSLIYQESFSYLVLSPVSVIEKYYLWQPVTYMFLHANARHIFWNLLMLFFIGGYVERSMGTKYFTMFYLFVGIATGVAYTIIIFIIKLIFGGIFLYYGGILGASGAILGIVMVFCLMNWNTPILLWAIIPIKGKWIILFIVILASIGTLSSFSGRECVSHLAHLLGLAIAHIFYGKPFKNWRNPLKKKKKVKSVFEEEYFHLRDD